MTELSKKVATRSRNMQTTILQRFAFVKNVNVAKRAGVDDSTVSRFLSMNLENTANMLAAAGLQVVPIDAQVISRERLNMLKELAIEYLSADLAHDEINEDFEDDE
jgi:hypothetical protein